MSSQVLYRKWRPQTLADVVGQEHATQTLLNALATGRVAHAYLFCGPRGTGKTSTGRILAKAVNCLNDGKGEPCNSCSICQAITEGHALDLVEIDAASNRGIDEIRDLREKVNFAPNVARYKVYIIDEVHMLTEYAFNALLKTLEEPPPHAIFILATTEPHEIPLTILSRCQRFDFRRLTGSAVVRKLEQICASEGIHMEPEALQLIARSATGSLRDAENLLEQLIVYHGSEISLAQVQAVLGITSDERICRLAQSILAKDIAAGLTTINSIITDGMDLRQFTRELVEYLREALLLKAGAKATADFGAEELAETKALIAGASMDDLLRAIKLLSQIDYRADVQSSLPLELALVELALQGKPERESIPVRGAPKEEIKVTAPPAPVPIAKSDRPAVEKPAASREKAEVPAKPHPPDLEYIRQNWREFVNSLRGMGSSGNLDAILRSACEPEGIEGNILVLRVYYPFHKEKIDDPKYRRMIERKLGEFFGTSYQLRCDLRARENKLNQQSHLVQEALKMGARIIDNGTGGNNE